MKTYTTEQAQKEEFAMMTAEDWAYENMENNMLACTCSFRKICSAIDDALDEICDEWNNTHEHFSRADHFILDIISELYGDFHGITVTGWRYYTNVPENELVPTIKKTILNFVAEHGVNLDEEFAKRDAEAERKSKEAFDRLWESGL